jgi:hypothetical protein
MFWNCAPESQLYKIAGCCVAPVTLQPSAASLKEHVRSCLFFYETTL